VIVAEAVGRALAEYGVGQVFGVVGSGNFHVTNALVSAGARFTAARHEGGAATMADAYARMSGAVGVLSVHQGCGLTNAMTGITEAAKSRTPMLVITAEATDRRSNFFVDQQSLAESVGAVSERLSSPASAVSDAVRALRRAQSERRTVVLNLPLQLQQAEIGDHPGTIAPGVQLAPPGPAPSAVRDLADALASASRPVFVAGRGARAARAELERLARSAGALLATSAVAKGLFHDHPWNLDVSGGFASPLTAELISGADLVVGWGCALNMWTMRHGALIGPEAIVAQVDWEPTAIGAVRPVQLGVIGDVAMTATAVNDELASRGHTAAGYREDELRERIVRENRWRDLPYDDDSTAETIDPRTLTIGLDDLLPTERVVAVDSGNFMGYPSMFLDVPDERGFCFTQAFQSIGLGLATAIGAALAQPDRLAVAACGDGGFLMSVADLETVARIGLPMVVVIYNDAGYGAEVHHFGPEGEALDTVRFPDTDIAAIGRGFGCDGITVREPGDLKGVADWLAGPRDRPLVVDAKVTSVQGSWWLAEAFGH
jgi:thiamine pyrophosphate-dependent acetolactate synthase large subunit-like protein